MKQVTTLNLLGLCCTTVIICGCLGPRQTGVRSCPGAFQAGPEEPLTFGVGNDTEAVWAPDGERIAFQTDRDGYLDLVILDLKTGSVTGLVEGAGHACYPAWTPDGRLVYAFSHRPETAAQSNADASEKGVNLRILEDGITRQLTQGYWRDYTPSVSADGQMIYYTSTQNNTGNNASIWRLPLRSDGKAEVVLHLDGHVQGAAQPSLSPNGRALLWSSLNGLFDNWRLCAARLEDPRNSIWLTPGSMSAYAPRWSPDGRLIAFTGFRKGEPGWGVYIIEPRSGAMARLETGPGQSRSPAWSPNGRDLVFENNRSGHYKLFRIPVTCNIAPAAPTMQPPPSVSRIEGQLVVKNGTSTWVDGAGNVLSGQHPTGLEGAVDSPGTPPVVFEKPAGLDYRKDTFYVKATFRLDRIENTTRIVAAGNYAKSSIAWQVFVRSTGILVFNSREPSGRFVGVMSDAPLTPGQTVTMVGMRDSEGIVRLWVDGAIQANRLTGATFDYATPRKISLGQQWNGQQRLNGRVLAFETGRGWPTGVTPPPTREDLFGNATR